MLKYRVRITVAGAKTLPDPRECRIGVGGGTRRWATVRRLPGVIGAGCFWERAAVHVFTRVTALRQDALAGRIRKVRLRHAARLAYPTTIWAPDRDLKVFQFDPTGGNFAETLVIPR